MKQLAVLIAIIAIIPLVQGLEITAPQNDITAQDLPTQTTLSWESNNTPYSVHLHTPSTQVLNETTNQTTIQTELEEGEYTLIITDSQNATANKTFSVIQEEDPITISISTDSEVYKTGDFIVINAQSSEQTTGEVIIYREGEEVTTYKGTIPQQISALTLDEPGEYEAVLEVGTQQATTSWLVEAVPELEADFSYENTILNKPATFEATVSGGEAPYEYRWVFSDQTNNQGEEITHYFFEEGTVTATLIVTDNQGTQTSVEKDIEIVTESYTLEIVVIDEDNNPLENIRTRIESSNGNQNINTDSQGEARYQQLQPNNYTILVYDNDKIHTNETVEITKDTNELYIIGEETEPEPQPEPQEEAEPETQEVVETQTQEVVETQEPQIEEAELQRQAFEEEKKETLAEIDERRFNFQLNNKQDQALIHLGLYKQFEEAKGTIQEARTQTQITRALREVPEKVSITNEKNTVRYVQAQDIQEAIDEYLEAQDIVDEDLQEQYRYNIETYTTNASIQTDSYTTKIQYPQQTETYRVTHKKINAPSNTRIIELIPQEIATHHKDLLVEEEYRIIRENPILEFSTNEYTYSAQSSATQEGQTLIVPKQLQEQPLFGGFAAIQLGSSDPARSLIYLVIIGLFGAGIFAGKKINEKQQATYLFEDFYELASQAAHKSATGEEKHVAELTPHIKEIYQELSDEHQQLCEEIVDELEQRKQSYEFKSTIHDVYETVNSSQGEINNISSAYERVLNEYEDLAPSVQEEFRDHLQVLEEHLDRQLST